MFFSRRPQPRFKRGQVVTLIGTVDSLNIRRYWLIEKRKWKQLHNKTHTGWFYGGIVIMVSKGCLASEPFSNRHEDDFSPLSHAL